MLETWQQSKTTIKRILSTFHTSKLYFKNISLHIIHSKKEHISLVAQQRTKKLTQTGFKN